MAYLGFFTALALAWAGLLGLHKRLSFLHLILIYWSFQAIAVFNYYQLHGKPEGVWLILSGIVLWIAGVWALQMFTPVQSIKLPAQTESFTPRTDERLLLALLGTVMGVVIYHYAVGGVPLFAEQIKQEAFEVGRSGLFGIPGRVSRFAPLLLIFLAMAYLQRVSNPGPRLRQIAYLAFALATATFIFSGHKSGLLVLVQAMIVASPYFVHARMPFHMSWRKLAVLGSFAFAGVIVIASIVLASKSSDETVAEALTERIFLIAGKPFDYVANSYVPAHGHGGGAYFATDIRYVLGQVGLSEGKYTGNQIVSAELHGRSPDAAFVIPITLTLIGQCYLNFGWIGALLGSFAFGLVCAWIYRHVQGVPGVLPRAIWFMIQFELFSSAVKGNLIFSFSSMFFGLAFTLILLYGLAFLLRAPQSVRVWPGVWGWMPGTSR